MSDLDTATARCRADFATTVTRLSELIRIPSCSFPGSDPRHLATAASATAAWARAAGLPDVQLIDGPWPPQVVARDHRAGPDAPTVLLYSHYDVQPPLRAELWTSPAYEPTIRNGRLYGRGSADDKAGIAASLAACAAWYDSAGHLPCNVTVWVEGEEEVGSPHLAAFLDTHLDLLRADCLLINDLGNIATGLPTITTSLRGMVACNVRLRALQRPVHSGMWGGAAPDAVRMLCRLLDGLADDDGRPLLPGISIPSTSPQALTELKDVPYDADAFADSLGLLPGGRSLVSDGATTLNRNWYQPNFSINAIHAGGEPGQAGNVIMDEAWARISIRTVPGMDAAAVHAALDARIHDLCPAGAEISIEREQSAEAWTTAPDHPLFDHCRAAFSAAYGRDCVTIGCGATIPFVDTLSRRLGDIPTLLIPVEDPDSRPHAEDESVHLGDLEHTSVALTSFLSRICN
ncbi:MAG: M20/M25/M40 family metallo-hydrolase [Planctomycetota bacterium]|jgi:acetylornithine deacetylase/succinyl-diaminopimelate desuccinylase-like protein